MFKGLVEDNGAPVLQLPIPDISQEKMNDIVQRFESSWIYISPLVRDPESVQHFVCWNERCHANGNVDLRNYDQNVIHSMLKKGSPSLLHEWLSAFRNVFSGERINSDCYKPVAPGEADEQGENGDKDDESDGGGGHWPGVVNGDGEENENKNDDNDDVNHEDEEESEQQNKVYSFFNNNLSSCGPVPSDEGFFLITAYNAAVGPPQLI